MSLQQALGPERNAQGGARGNALYSFLFSGGAGWGKRARPGFGLRTVCCAGRRWLPTTLGTGTNRLNRVAKDGIRGPIPHREQSFCPLAGGDDVRRTVVASVL